jgi:hypothetical protein
MEVKISAKKKSENVIACNNSGNKKMGVNIKN